MNLRLSPLSTTTLLVVLLTCFTSFAHAGKAVQYAGSESCRDCHERFYKLWAPSRHGKAMQPYTDAFSANYLSTQANPIIIGGEKYTAEIQKGKGYVLKESKDGKKKYPIKHVLGGKYVYYFLTPMDRGRLQTLPLAYDISQKEWFDMAGSGIRHASDEAVSWLDPVYTFNTSCHGCHVSQLRNNYDPETGKYNTTWAEPGINCETCHGPSSGHNRVCREATPGTVPKDLKILGGKGKFTIAQNTDSCAPCHAQMIPLTGAFMPGDRFYDHFDLTCLEDSDFYPDGRDLGENYTHTSWSLSPCAQSGKLGCLHCHTSSGRFRQMNAPNQSCAPCHADKVDVPHKHTMHKPGKDEPTCVSCHMVKTTFARMDRSDHSMLPPTPAATIEFGSPNACNTCHTDKTPDWADAAVRKWRKRDYQASVLYRASLIQSARDGDWNRLPEILAYLESPENDDIFVASLLRLLRSCNDSSKWKTIMAKLGETSPLVRAAAAEALTPPPGTEAVEHLLKATGDDFRLVRVKAAAALAGIPSRFVPANKHAQLEKADREYVAFLTARPDMWTSHYNLGNYRMQRGEFNEADKAYSIAHELGPRAVPPLVNQSMIKARQGDLPAAQKVLLQALKISPVNPAVLFNLGLLESELGNSQKAADYLEACLKSDPGQDRAAYNLALLNASANPKKALDFARKALSIQRRPDYAFTVAYLQNSSGNMEGARNRLWKLVDEWPGHGDAYLFLNELLRNSTDREKLKIKLQSAVGSTTIPAAERQRLKRILQNLD